MTNQEVTNPYLLLVAPREATRQRTITCRIAALVPMEHAQTAQHSIYIGAVEEETVTLRSHSDDFYFDT